MRYVDLWEDTVDPTCHPTSIKKWAQSNTVKVWMYKKEDYDKTKFFMAVEVFKIYCKAFKGWMHTYSFTAQELGLKVCLI